MADVRIQQYPLKQALGNNDYFLIADASDVDVNGWLKYKKVLAEDLPTIVTTAEDITIAQIQSRRAASDLTIGKFYRITNSASGVSPLFVQAVAINAVSYQAFDAANPLTTINYNVLTDTIRWSLNETNAPISLGSLSAATPLSYNSTTGQFSISQANTSTDGYLSATDWNTFDDKQDALSGSGIVKSTAGTISYLTDDSANWNTAFNDSIVSAAVTGTTTKTLTLNQEDGGTVTASWSDLNTDAVTSVFGRTGAVVADEGDYSLTQLSDVTIATPTNGQVLKYNGTTWVNGTDTDTGLTSVGLTMPLAFSVANSPLTANGTLAVTGAGLATQYVRGDGTLADFPTNGGGGSSISFYLNGSVNQGTFGGSTYYQLGDVANTGTGVDFNISSNGLIAQFITDVNVPNIINIPAGNFNIEFYFSASSGGGNPNFYVELYKYNGSTFTLLGSNAFAPEGITNGTTIDSYFTNISVAQATLLVTDRLAVRVYVNNSSRTITLHTQANHLGQIITTLSKGMLSLNGQSNQTQYFAIGTTGTDFNISSTSGIHNFNIPTASASNRGALSSADWTTFNSKVAGSGTTNYLPKFTGANSLTNSFLFNDATTLQTYSEEAGGYDGLKIDISNRLYELGDFSSLSNGTTFSVNDDSSTIKTIYGGNEKGLKLDFANNEAYYNNNNHIGLFSIGWGLYLGDWDGQQNATTLQILDDTRVIKTNDGGNDKGLFIDFANNLYALGDGNTTNNGTTFIIDDNTQVIKTQNQGADNGLYIDFGNNEYYLRYDSYGVKQTARQTYIGDLGYQDWGELLSINGNNGIISTQRGFIGDNSYKGLYIDFTAYHNNFQYNIDKINGSYQNFPNAVSVFYNTDYVDTFLNHNLFSSDGKSSFKFGQFLETFPNEGGGMLRIELDKGTWQSTNSILYWNNEEGFYLNNYNNINLRSYSNLNKSELQLFGYESSLFNEGDGYTFALKLDTVNQVIKTQSNYQDKGLYLDFYNGFYNLQNEQKVGLEIRDGYNVKLGDITGDYYCGTHLAIDNDLCLIKTSSGGSDKGLYLDFANNNYAFGNNGTAISSQITSAIDNISLQVYNDDIENYLSMYLNLPIGLINTNYNNQDKGLYLDFVNLSYQIGDWNVNNNGTTLLIDDLNGLINTYYNGQQGGLYLDLPNRNYFLGDWNGNNNGTYFYVNDNTSIIYAKGNGQNKGLYIDFNTDTYILGKPNADDWNEDADGFTYRNTYTSVGSAVTYGTYLQIGHNENRTYLQTNRVNYRTLTTTQINALTGNVKGDVVFNSTLNVLCFYDGSGWKKVSHTAM
jgi:hypothetical protein